MIELDLLRRQAAAWGIALDETSVQLLADYARRMRDYTEANVVGTRDLRRLVLEHVLDSLSCLLLGHVRNPRNLVDVGTGAGLPGIPIKIVQAEMRLTLIEANGKKTRFLQQTAQALGLESVDVVRGRAEEIGHEATHRENYDLATARAVAPLSTVAEYCVPLVKKGGQVVAMKGSPGEDELRAGSEAAQALGAELTEVLPIEFLPELGVKDKHLIVITKKLESPGRYPRRTGVPKKKPLGT